MKLRNIFLKLFLLISLAGYTQSLQLLNQLKKGQERNEKALNLSDDFTTRVTTDGGTSISTQALFEPIAYTVDKASLVLKPSGTKVGKLYSVEPTDGTGDGTHTRASTATYIDSNGIIQTAAINEPRIDFADGIGVILNEPSATNLYLNSAVIVTQNITTTATDYTVSFYGTGTITFTGTYTGSLVGTGANDRVEITFTATSGTLTSTISGTVTNGQAETGVVSSSWIETLGSSLTRSADSTTGLGDVNTFSELEGVFYVEMAALSDDNTNRTISIRGTGTYTDYMTIRYRSASGLIRFTLTAKGVSIRDASTTIVQTDFNTLAIKWSVLGYAFYLNNIEVFSGVTDSTFTDLNQLVFSNTDGSSPMYFKLKDGRYYKLITDAISDGIIPN